jgi:hypothetical protein
MTQLSGKSAPRLPALAIVAVVLFMFEAILIIVGVIDRRFSEVLTLGGLACLAGAHVSW